MPRGPAPAPHRQVMRSLGIALAGIVTITVGAHGCLVVDGDGRTPRPPAPGKAPKEGCAKGRGHVRVQEWEKRVTEFEGRQYSSKRRFRRSKRALLRDLAATRQTACAWELHTVDDLMARVRTKTY